MWLNSLDASSSTSLVTGFDQVTPNKIYEVNQLMFSCVHTCHARPCCECCLRLIDCWHWLIVVECRCDKQTIIFLTDAEKLYGFDHESIECIEVFVSNQMTYHALMREATPRQNWFEEDSSRFVQLACKIRKSSLTLTKDDVRFDFFLLHSAS